MTRTCCKTDKINKHVQTAVETRSDQLETPSGIRGNSAPLCLNSCLKALLRMYASASTFHLFLDFWSQVLSFIDANKSGVRTQIWRVARRLPNFLQSRLHPVSGQTAGRARHISETGNVHFSHLDAPRSDNPRLREILRGR
jgi:hypothetical protein